MASQTGAGSLRLRGIVANVKFSIVTPSYNQGRYIRDCIESVRSQTGVEWEHLVQDAGSTDETAAVLAEYPHLQVVREPDKGMSDGINRGFLRATGDWVMWLNTDDYLLPGALEKVARFAAQHPVADVIYGGWNFVDGEKKFLKRMKMFPFDLGMMNWPMVDASGTPTETLERTRRFVAGLDKQRDAST